MLIEVYTKEECPLCETAKKLLKEKNVPFQELVIGKDVTREEVLAKFPGVKNAPVVSIDGRMIKEVADFQMLLEG
jgi:glutaredoxin